MDCRGMSDYKINTSSSGLIYVHYKDKPTAEVFASQKEAEKYIKQQEKKNGTTSNR